MPAPRTSLLPGLRAMTSADETAQVTYVAFAWQSNNPEMAKTGNQLVAEFLKETYDGRCAVNKDDVRWLDDGCLLHWKTPTIWKSGYMWFARRVGHLAWGLACFGPAL